MHEFKQGDIYVWGHKSNLDRKLLVRISSYDSKNFVLSSFSPSSSYIPVVMVDDVHNIVFPSYPEELQPTDHFTELDWIMYGIKK